MICSVKWALWVQSREKGLDENQAFAPWQGEKKKKLWPFTAKFDRIMQMIAPREQSLTPNFVQLYKLPQESVQYLQNFKYNNLVLRKAILPKIK